MQPKPPVLAGTPRATDDHRMDEDDFQKVMHSLAGAIHVMEKYQGRMSVTQVRLFTLLTILKTELAEDMNQKLDPGETTRRVLL